MRTLPTGSVDPNFDRRVRNRRQLNSLQNTWPYGYSMPIAVRYTQDAFSRSGWLWPVAAKGEYNVLPQLDINNTIDHRPEGDEKWFLENEKTVTQFRRKLAAERPFKDICDEYN